MASSYVLLLTIITTPIDGVTTQRAGIQQHSRMRRARGGMGNVATIAAWLSNNMGVSKRRMTEGCLLQ